MSDTVEVDRAWLDKMMEYSPDCPFCGSSNVKGLNIAGNDFLPRRGCLSCDKWLEPVRLSYLGLHRGSRGGQDSHGLK